jgi:hypothetical protein
MAELDFIGLRAEVEAATMLPDFGQVARRARRARRRARLATVSAALAVLAILAPAGLISARERASHQTPPISHPDTATPFQIGLETPPAAPSAPPVAFQSTIVAAGGVDLNDVYALINVCAADSCNLQLSKIQLTPSAGNGPDRIGLLRDKSSQFLSGFRLDALSQTSVVASAVPPNGGRRFVRVDTGRSVDATANATAKVGDQVAPIDGSGELWGMDPQTNQLGSLANQPPVRQPSVASVPASRGLWVTGTDASGKQLVVATSQDAGHNWRSATLEELPSDAGPVVLATYNGHKAYLLLRGADKQFELWRTNDTGATWQRMSTQLPWQADNRSDYGLVVRPDGSLLAWLASSPTVTYAQSHDEGSSFTNVQGPGGPVIQVSDGYVSLSGPPKVSTDGLTWRQAALPVLPVAN